MKRGIFFWLVAAMAVSAHAQSVGPLPVQNAPNKGDERSRIDAARLNAKAEFDQQAKVCYTKFAVFDCIAQARGKQRALLDALRRQEVVLNQAAREQKVQAQLARLQAKALNTKEAVPPASDPHSNPGAASTDQRLPAQSLPDSR